MFSTVIRCHRVGGLNIITIFSEVGFSGCTRFTHVNRKSLNKGNEKLTFLSGVVGHRPRFGRCRGTAIRVPGAIILYASVFSRFVVDGGLCPVTLDSTDSSRVLGRFLRTRLPSSLVTSFFAFFRTAGDPVTVHSDSLLRSTRCRPFTNVCSACVVPCLTSGCRVLRVLTYTVGNICTSIFCHSSGTCVATAHGIVSRRGVTMVLRRIINGSCNAHCCPAVDNILHSLGCCPVNSRRTRRNVTDLTLKLNGCVISNNRALHIYPCRPRRILRASRARVTLHSARARFCTLSARRINSSFGISSKFGVLGFHIGSTMRSRDLGCVTSAFSPCSRIVGSNICRANHGLVAFTKILRRSIMPLPRLVRVSVGYNSRTVHQPIRVRFTYGVRTSGAYSFCLLRVHPVISTGRVLSRSIETVPSTSYLLHSRGSLNRNVDRSIASIICIGCSCRFSTVGGFCMTSSVRHVGHGFLTSNGGCILVNPNH